MTYLLSNLKSIADNISRAVARTLGCVGLVSTALCSPALANAEATAAIQSTTQAATATRSSAEVEAQISKLIEQMTIEEKVGQLTQFSDPGDLTGPRLEDEVAQRKRELIASGVVGSMLNAVGAERTRYLQKIAVEESRLGIPMIFAYDVIHGHKTAFPIPLAEAASWDMQLIRKGARVAAIEASAQGLHWTFAPMVDMSRDPRWGRVMEGAGEDPFLASAVAVARVRGFQGDDLAAHDTIAATLKHFAGYGFAEAGRDYNTVDVGTVTLHNVILAPFRAGVTKANAQTVMNSFSTLNGIPATGDRYLQRDILKGQWGFAGLVVTDWGSAIEMVPHGFAADGSDAARLALTAGADMDMESFVYQPHLPALVKSGKVSMAQIDEAVRRVLRVKFAMGLFDDPYRYSDVAREKAKLMSTEHRTASRKMAEASIVLLKNDAPAADNSSSASKAGALLPLQAKEKIALIGALAADKDSPIGNWRAQAETSTAISLVEAFQQAGLDFTYAQGAAVEIGGEASLPVNVVVNMTDKSGFAEAVSTARQADKVIIVLGEDSFQTGEGRSRADIGFPGVQQELLEAVVAANPNVVLVVMSGRPLILTWADANVPSIVQAWHLGHESGTALTNVLTGKVNPSGKLPMTFPRSLGQIPIYYNYLNTGRPGPREDVFWSHYIDETNAPLYPFGHGLSYSSFAYSDLAVHQEGDKIIVSAQITNDSNRDGHEVVQLYIHDRAASVSRPEKELKGFRKILLKAGESQQVTFELSKQELGFYNGQGDYIVEAGMFDIFVGGSSDTTLQAEIRYTLD